MFLQMRTTRTGTDGPTDDRGAGQAGADESRVALIAHHRSLAERRLMEAVGAEGSLCTIARSGKPVPSVKYHEGAVAALAEADRLAGGAHELRHLRDRWQRAVGVTAEAPDWVAYRAGGVDAIEAVLEEL